MIDIPEKSVAQFGSREEAVEFPFDMRVTAYLMRHHHFPRFARRGGPVFHYTDAAGLEGIACTNTFWASGSTFLNDPTEGTYGIDCALEVLDEYRGNTAVEELCQLTIAELKAPRETDLYVVSFCNDGDLLGQWRGYGQFGQGYALGFDREKLSPHAQVGWLIEVIYDRELIDAAIKDTISIYRDFLITAKSYYLDDMAKWWASALQIVALSVKHPSYLEEQEIRLIFRNSPSKERKCWEPKVKYRSRGNDILPYISTTLDFDDAKDPAPLPITQVILGPGVAPANLQSIRNFLVNVNHPNVVVLPSRVPFTG